MKSFILCVLVFSVISLDGYSQTLLPISLKNFSVQLKDKNTAEIKWDIIHQNNAIGYSVEHSTDGRDWHSIGFVTEVRNDHYKHYSLQHVKPGNGTNYYRIYFVDSDGDRYYSQIKTLIVKSKVMFSVWPNPAQHNLQIQNYASTGPSKAIIMDQTGFKMAAVVLVPGTNTLDISSYRTGKYFVQVVEGNKLIGVFQFLKQ